MNGPTNRQRRLGVLMCGGQSRRMGRDKARLDLNGRSLLQGPLSVLESVAPEVVLASGSGERYAELGKACVLDELRDGGPLAGLAAGLRFLVGRDAASDNGDDGVILVLACDMPHARAEVFELLLERMQRQEADLCLLAGARGMEPLYGVYSGRVLPAVERALCRGERRLIAFHKEVKVSSLEEGELLPGLGVAALATNVNTPEDYARERRA